MRITAAILLIVIFLSSTIGISVGTCVCADDNSTHIVFTEDHNCCESHKKESHSCCHSSQETSDEEDDGCCDKSWQFFQVDDEYTSDFESINLSLKDHISIPVLYSLDPLDLKVKNSAALLFEQYKPPLIQADLSVLYSSFLI